MPLDSLKNVEIEPEIVYPSAKLGSVTRKKNEILNIIKDVSVDTNLVKEMFHSYDERVSSLRSSYAEIISDPKLATECSQSYADFKVWVKKVESDISLFTAEMRDWFRKSQADEIRYGDSASNVKSNASRTSSKNSSTLRMKLLEAKAQIQADEVVEEAEEENKKQKKQIEKYKKKVYIRKLEEFLNEYEDVKSHSAASCKGSIHGSSNSKLRNKIKQDPLQQNPYFDHSHKAASITSRENQNSNELADAMLMVAKNQIKAILPKNEPKNFDGDATKYLSFIQDFESMIAAYCESNSERLHYLERYTSGLPLELIRSCRSKDPESGYKKAMELLKQEFGNERSIASAYLQKLGNWKQIKNEDAKSLREYSIFLMSCNNMMSDYSALNQLNNSHEIYKNVMKLPFKMRDRWRSIVMQIQKENRLENFSDFTDFVRKQATLLNLPLYGDICDAKQNDKSSVKNSVAETRKKVLTTTTGKNQPGSSCIVCKKDGHSILKCFFFKARSNDEKMSFVKDKKLCFACLEPNHSSKFCKNKLQCEVCSYRHPTVMHRNKEKPTEEWHENKQETKTDPEETSQEIDSSLKTKALATNYSTPLDRKVHAAIPVKVRIKGQNDVHITYMGIDPYCGEVFISESLLNKFGVRGIETTVPITTMHSKNLPTKMKVLNNLEIIDMGENEYSLVPVVYSRSPWPFDKEDSPLPSDIESFPYLKDVPFSFIDSKIEILVGLSMSDITKPLKTVEGPNENSPYATLHKHGWAFNGVVNISRDANLKCFRTKLQNKNEIDLKFQQFCARDFIDHNPELLAPSYEDQLWEERVQKSLVKNANGSYEVALPFKDENFIFPNNREQVLKRLFSIKRRLQSDKDFYSDYSEFMNMMIVNDFAEEVKPDEPKPTEGKLWYLFHFGIYHKKKKKLRIVFDASLRFQGVSLNDTLLQGPDLINSLLGVLLRFREDKVAVTADISKMFYAVKVKETHRNYLRFFWFPNGDLNLEPIEYKVTVHIFGAVSSPSIANYVLRQAACTEEAMKYSKATRETVCRNFYVDDWMRATNLEDEASLLIKELTEMLGLSGFKLTAFVSTSREVLKEIKLDELGKNIKELNFELDDLPYERALGVTWDVQQDTFGFRLQIPDRENTKRGILSTIFSVYDPLGLAAPAIFSAKRIFQNVCHENMNWDDLLPDSLISAWNKWKESIVELCKYRLPRCLKPCFDVKSTQLHMFSDGSNSGFSSVGYLRFLSHDNIAHCSFVMAKTRLVPMKSTAVTSIPRIELNGAKLSVTVQQILKRELTLEINKVYFWTDSMTVLKYINCENRRFQRFVANRISFIRAHTELQSWRHVPSELNPADIASRGTTASVMIATEMWKLGPRFLWEGTESWPHENADDFYEVFESDPELVKVKSVFLVRSEEKGPIDVLLESSSSWIKTKIRVAWMIQLQQYAKTKVWSNKKLSPEHLQKAEIAIWQYVQKMHFDSTIKKLTLKEKILKKDPLIKLNPFIDQHGTLRVGGRLSNYDASFEVVHPVILPSDHHAVKLMVQSVHHMLGHMGKETMMTQLKQKYWIVGINSFVRKIVRDCIACRKRQGRPVEQLMGEIPEERLSADLPVFSRIGIDAFGPFVVVRGRTRVKRYGLIFTCLTSRAIHLEVLFTLESSSFINALRRFVARRGMPLFMRSDNGTNFVGAERELKEELSRWNQSKQVSEWMLQRNLIWKFNPPAGSHFGGIWEREIRTVRKVLSGLTNEQPIHLDDEGLNTLFCEIESILNSRPLTSLSDSPSDLEPLTPNHLLLNRSGLTFPPGLFNKDDLYARRKWKQIQYLADLFWHRWKGEYIPLLQERQKWNTRERSVAVGDLVLLVDQLLPRNQWSLGRIEKVFADKHCNVRSVEVKVNKVKGEYKNFPVVMQRPISKLILLRPFDEL